MSRTGIILAGGKSSRMGQNKALLTIEGATVIERIAHELTKITDQLLIVTNTFRDFEFLGIPMVEDMQKGKGPIAGIHAGLTATTTNANLIVACDMPFISSSLGDFLLTGLDEYQAVIPELGGQLHPLYGAYRKDALQVVTNALTNNQLRIRSVLEQLNVQVVTEELLQRKQIMIKETDMFNMNDPKEYEKALRVRTKGSEKR
ncbi:molybdenum cofactor guanylyltransferase [Robertmurraya korlensis]|uniref:molybdenum cofactor guanylyltransferase n=1 Tax=Robertmurraya korlensis TaxID=519977 RepID=UPI000827022C|nr:molybdenum cofactor guanylyltransferase [Robertmurraya korlensis]